ncbi:cobalt ABC transporter permease [Prochlorococcus marinus str. MU1404]|uniref:energy-coupling factor transporter transmembrane component T family protein n=1 Tax=Prochlorococcus marinus TaxID=1219 RepID=UPI001AD9772D|nr:energy-coupling factor transporter transmembrane protein EcfT [Prochlorococcus marinus]MBO8229591.1 energy-coupling factor transporter transmembrane protein EcfT [Prochlorococcus marinus XMU1404]MBW3072668.1 cobalt ABC transporter permease [Prochlorococcus marinus str. MU1404]MCR8546074.1 energy-coupling factor transporter transmembrane protein EcfT [Prochlorococcus marinus CUG1432]
MNILTKFSVGQYVYGNRSWLRIIDSRLKIIIVMIFLITPIWAGPIYRLSLVGCLLLITFLSLLPSRVWWRSLFLLTFLSLLIGFISILASSDIQSLESYLRNPDELQEVIENYKKWNILEIPSQKIWFINFGPYNLSRKALELGIKTSTLIFTVIHSVNLMLLTTLQEDIVWALSWFMYPLRKIGLPISKWLFQLLIALRFIPLVQEEFQNIIKSVSVRSINFRNLGFKKSFNVLLFLVERLFQNIFLRIDQGAESLLSKKEIIIKTDRFRTSYPSRSFNVILNTLSICFISIAIFLRKLYGAL